MMALLLAGARGGVAGTTQPALLLQVVWLDVTLLPMSERARGWP